MSNVHNPSPAESVRPLAARVDLCALVAICAVFAALRVPLMYRLPGGQDEAEFSVPGVTVLREGIPRVPYIPSRDPKGFFYRYDEVFLSHPPACFYWQAAFYCILPPGYGTARLASGVAAILAIVLIYLAGRQLAGSRAAALWGAGLYSFARVCFFPGMSSRPDMLCGMLGFAAFASFLRWRDTQRRIWLAATALFLGLGGLTHPFAIIYAVQIGIWTLLVSGPPLRRLRHLACLVAGTMLVFSMWLFLIVPHFEVFQSQFFNNVLNRSAPGLLNRLLWPWEAIRSQTRMILEHAGPIQTAVMFGAMVMATVLAVRRRDARLLKLAVLAGSSVYLLVLFEGSHATKGYWCYPGGWLFLCAGWCSVWAGRKASLFCRRRIGPGRLCRAAPALVGACLLLAMLPGAGIRAWAAHVQHWNDPLYDARRFVRILLRRVPPEARAVVDIAYVLPFYLEGRSVIRADNHDLRAPDDYLPYDYYVAGPESIDHGFPRRLGSRFVESFGERENVFACYAELHEYAGTSCLSLHPESRVDAARSAGGGSESR